MSALPGRDPTSGWEGYIVWAWIVFALVMVPVILWWGFS